MAEAIELPSMSTCNKYFCYHCNREVFLFRTTEIVCPECSSDFVEEVPDDDDDNDDLNYEDDSDGDEGDDNLFRLLSVENLFRRVMSEDSEPSRDISTDVPDVPNVPNGLDVPDVPQVPPRRIANNFLETLHPDIIDGIGQAYSTRGFLQQLEESILQGHSERIRHVGDYLFGEDLDALSTMLLNQSEIRGPPPLPNDQIKLLPVITVCKEDVEKEAQCTICMEDFLYREKAKNLPCSHYYHDKCITQWLERHATCPNCRKPVEIQSKNRRSQSCPRAEYSLRSSDQRRPSESSSSSVTGFFTTSMNPFRFL